MRLRARASSAVIVACKFCSKRAALWVIVTRCYQSNTANYATPRDELCLNVVPALRSSRCCLFAWASPIAYRSWNSRALSMSGLLRVHRAHSEISAVRRHRATHLAMEIACVVLASAVHSKKIALFANGHTIYVRRRFSNSIILVSHESPAQSALNH